MPWFPRRIFHDWPQGAQDLPTSEVIKLYENGFAGCSYSPEEKEKFAESQAWPDGEMAAHEFGIADTGAGKLVVPFVFVMEYFPNCWPGSQGQARGDCVSWGNRNAVLLTLAGDIASGKVDEKTGKPEEVPEVPLEGIADGVLSTESIYWHRGYNGDGWMCPAAARVVTTVGGAVLRKNYPDHGIDLTRYSGSTAGRWGSQKPPAKVLDLCDDHLAHQATEVDSLESTRDFLFNGYGIADCGGEGYSNRRDENGVSARSGSWAHSMSVIAVDDRDVIKQKYNEPLVCILNSWAKWSSGPRDILDSAAMVPAGKKEKWVACGLANASTGNLMIPEGSFWARWSHCRNRERFAFSGVNGWPARVLPLPWIF